MGLKGKEKRGKWKEGNGIIRTFYGASLLSTLLLPLYSPISAGDQDTALMKTTAMEAGKIKPSDQKLFEESIRQTKDSIARETLDVFYKDALDAYHENRYDEALELLD